ncbi:hypothetical protein HN51_045357, partial [Arachis hypogaea]
EFCPSFNSDCHCLLLSLCVSLVRSSSPCNQLPLPSRNSLPLRTQPASLAFY